MEENLSLLLTGSTLLYLGVIVYVANQADQADDRRPTLNALLYSLVALLLLFGVNILLASADTGGVTTTDGVVLPRVDPTASLGFFALTLVVAFVCTRLIASASARGAVTRLVGGGAYDPESRVHLTAVILLWLLIVYTLGNFILSGGIDGLADSYAQGIAPGELVFQQTLWVLFALLGVGALIRRGGAATLERLGLRNFSLRDIGIGALVGVGLYAVIIAMGALWALFVTPEQLAEQTAASQQLAQSFDTLPMILLLAVSVAIGEEVLFRGALQPIFGIGLTSAFFALLHTQYTLTPASFGIFFVSLGIGWLRFRSNTMAAMSAHFVYNFIQLFLALLIGGG